MTVEMGHENNVISTVACGSCRRIKNPQIGGWWVMVEDGGFNTLVLGDVWEAMSQKEKDMMAMQGKVYYLCSADCVMRKTVAFINRQLQLSAGHILVQPEDKEGGEVEDSHAN